ncbi:hypothetical protein [Culicoidibacter larvae]|uniref:Uncharacterized protein n=1 Tax=Culicoidibacter larvae TaxID=2579976 RepID=A0A5R8QCL5_9FIRM|nr:hypothetical protein [Culicoidibacter larvae]TLG74248.1 hypothetical protein FEZ08_05955 [Culicoidibacter larvae]
MQSKTNQFIISGKGLIPEGNFDYVKVNGSGKAFKPVTIKLLEINGNLTAMAPIIAEVINITGTGKFRELTSEKFSVYGGASIDGPSSIEHLNIRGNFKSTGNISSNRIDVYGKLRCTGEIEAENVMTEGAIVAELVNAENITMNVWHRSTISIIQATSIQVFKNPLHKVSEFFSTRDGFCLVVNEIEADRISLVATKAQIVRGEDVTIGEGCNIELVEYTGTLTVAPGAIVKSQVKVI